MLCRAAARLSNPLDNSQGRASCGALDYKTYRARMTRAERITQSSTELAEVKTAISRIITGGQAYSAEGRAMTKADLKVLQERERMLETKLARLQSGGIRTFGVRFS